mgnify:CR=1 FL=1
MIAERMTGYGNWTRRAANGAIINIGLRDAALALGLIQAAAAGGAGAQAPAAGALRQRPPQAQCEAVRDTMLFNDECRVEQDPDRGPRLVIEQVLKLT